MTNGDRPIDTEGGAYGRGPQHHDAYITEVAPGTPCGEFLRRYWHPVALADEATDRPRQVRLLGEDLILFRDRTGLPGLLYPRCIHRGTTLYYGRVEDRGIRCCYHGWLFDTEGRCLEQPCEPDGGKRKHTVRQPWYPVEERYGLIFAYMGPPARRPVLPRYDIFEGLGAGEELRPDDSGLGSGGDGPGLVVPCNWLQHTENVLDTYHVPILHGTFSGTQFVPEMATMPDVTWEFCDNGVSAISLRSFDDGRVLHRVTQVLLPTLRVVPSPRLAPGPCTSIGWVIPVDDTHYKILNVFRQPKGQPLPHRSSYGGKRWSELTEEEHQRMPGDYEAQVGQGPITLHSEERLVSSDRGVSMLRRLLREQIKAVEDGGDPSGVAFDPEAALVHIPAGNFFEEAA